MEQSGNYMVFKRKGNPPSNVPILLQAVVILSVSAILKAEELLKLFHQIMHYLL
jgi:hypothetical protein